jgi:hypothetical protein
MTNLRFGIRDLLWAMAVVGLAACLAYGVLRRESPDQLSAEC